MVLELQTCYSKLGTQSRLFTFAFYKQAEFLKKEPIAEMLVPSFVRRGIHEQRVLAALPVDFWPDISDDTMAANGFDPYDVPASTVKIIKQKIHDLTAKGEGSADKLREFCPKDLALSPTLSGQVKSHISTVQFYLHFDCVGRSSMETCTRILHDNNNLIANALMALPHGRAIVANVLNMAKAAETDSQSVDDCKSHLESIINEYPKSVSRENFEEATKNLGGHQSRWR